MILFRATPPPSHVVVFFESLFPGFWARWLGAADSALREIDAEGVDDIIITSWWRSLVDNRAVNGEPDSQHLVGLALDVVPAKQNLRSAIDEAAASFTEFGFVAVPASRHLHIQTFPAGLLRSVGVLDALSV
jgi:hypothetical protein